MRVPFPPLAPRARRPTVAGRFVMLDQIGSGGMGSVWRAVDLRTGDMVAVKVLGRHNGALLARFVREQGIRIRHPHVLAPIGWAADDEVVLFAMDLVEGGTVADLLAEHGPLPVGFVAVLVEQLLTALGAVHGAGLAHRDVKPANLLLEASGRGQVHLRLGDFGVAAPMASARFTTLPGAIGTDGYMAPEQARGSAPDPTQDLYAVGRVAWELVSGLPPDRQDRIGSHPLRPLVERLLAPDPTARPRSAAEALDLLHRLRIAPELGPSVPRRLGPAPVHSGLGEGRVDVLGWLAVAVCLAVLVVCGWSLLGLVS